MTDEKKSDVRKESDADLKMEKTEDEMKPEEKALEEKIEDEVEELEGPCSSPKAIAMTITKVLLALGFLYIFFVSLGLLSDAFIVLGGAGLNEILAQAEEILSNPFCGLIIGILLTVLVQSSSTSTSIFITMTGSGLLKVNQAIYMIMGANVGTSITSTIVAFGNSSEKEEFARAMASAVVLAAFNWMTVFVLLPIEALTSALTSSGEGFLEWLTGICTQGLSDDSEGGSSGGSGGLNVITDPFSNLILNADKGGLGDQDFNGTFVAYCKNRASDLPNVEDTEVYCAQNSCEWPECNNLNECYLYTPESGEDCFLGNKTIEETFYFKYGDDCVESHYHMFMNACWSDAAVGGTVLALALFMMFISLAMIVKCLKSVLEGTISQTIANIIDKDLPYVPWLTPYIYVLAGMGMTIAVQSSSIILAILTPICGLGIVSLERAFPIVVGCDIGTTFTGLLAAFANPGQGFRASMQVSMSHLFFNVFGACLWFVVPIMRNIPVGIAQFAARRTAKYRWWAVNYIIGFFFVFPILFFLLSLASSEAVTALFLIVVLSALIIASINTIRETECGKKCLPGFLLSWKWLPLACRSLAPYDKFCSCSCCGGKQEEEEEVAEEVTEADLEGGVKNEGFEKSEEVETAEL